VVLLQKLTNQNTMLKILYKDEYTASSAQQNVASIAFAGTVLGQLVFGYTADHWSRRHSLLISTIILIVFAALGAGSYGAGGSIQGMFAALTAYRFLLGIGIGKSYDSRESFEDSPRGISLLTVFFYRRRVPGWKRELR
jgi:MFS family permease